ncbi:hypothetical protein CXB51_005254 [Gossypium anomalum]|uniref:Uncharacterized protein n=1 Tax=Gossypium anomalum TaxID=47600 RepID=A0A8J5Z0R3_9ROSI|nr:hypothetical protein CXB51_005254 [Gossypium anomalum]
MRLTPLGPIMEKLSLSPKKTQLFVHCTALKLSYVILICTTTFLKEKSCYTLASL